VVEKMRFLTENWQYGKYGRLS